MKMLVLIPGWNELDFDLRTLVDGRDGIPGFAQRGYHCVLFPPFEDTLRDRIDRFADFMTGLKMIRPDGFPVNVLGYSAGGLVVRGFLRAYPERAAEVATTIQIGTPNAGLIDRYLVPYSKMLHIPDVSVGDMDVASDFLRWINGTGGHWEPTKNRKHQVWRLDAPPIVAPAGSKIHAIVGRVPRIGEADGIIANDSVTLNGAIPFTLIEAPTANHMNLVGTFNILMFFYKFFLVNDWIWPRTIEIADRVMSASEESL